MNTDVDPKSVGEGLVYVKPVMVADLPEEVQDQAGDLEQIFSVHNSDGEQIALVADMDLAYHLAREHDMEPVTLH